MLFRIAAERKRREFDPALAAVRDALRGTAEGTAEGKGEGKVRERLQQMEELLATMDGLSARFLADETASRAMLKLFFGGLLAKEEGEL